MDIQKYKQSTLMSCGPACILMLMSSFDKSIELSQKHEIKILVKSLLLPIRSAWEFGLAAYASERGFDVDFYTESNAFEKECKILQEKGIGVSVNIIFKEVTSGLIKDVLSKNMPLAVEMDYYYLSKRCHFPHYIIIKERNDGLLEIIDPYDGQCKSISEFSVERGLESLRSILKINPVMIVIKKQA